MARDTTTRLVRPLSKGQITIPAAMRKALGITGSSLLQLSLEEDKIVISNIGAADDNVRLYTDEELAAFLEEDEHTTADVEYVRELFSRAGLL